MDPSALDPGQWSLIHRALLDLVLMAGLGMTAAAAFVLGRAVLPALSQGGAAPTALRLVRWGAYAAAALAVLLAVWGLWRALAFAGAVQQHYYPRFLI